MFSKEQYFDSNGMIGLIERTLNHVDRRLVNHGRRVAYLSYLMMEEMGTFTEADQRDVCLLAILHDIGAYKSEEIDEMVRFEMGDVWRHSIYGYLFLKHFSFLREKAEVVLYHHMEWCELKRRKASSKEIAIAAQIINLADRADLFLETEGIDAMHALEMALKEKKGTTFMPELVDVFYRLDKKLILERDERADAVFRALLKRNGFSDEEVTGALQLLVFTIDFRSRHTVTHTITTAGISRELALIFGLSKEGVKEVACGALLHDLGKISVPVEILEKPGRLTAEEMAIMQTHVTLTKEILGDAVPEIIREIALRHHEKMDGSGYPLGLQGEEMTLQQKILVVADIVSALVGTRSYKDSYSKERTLGILRSNCEAGKLDGLVVDVIEKNYDEIIEKVGVLCRPVLETYDSMAVEYEEWMDSFADYIASLA